MIYGFIILFILIFIATRFRDSEFDAAYRKTHREIDAYPAISRSKTKLKILMSELIVFEDNRYFFKDKAGGIEIANKILLLEPENFDALTCRGACLAEIGMYLNAIDDFEKALLIKKDASIHGLLGLAYYDIGNLNKAIYHYKEAVEWGAENYTTPLLMLKALSPGGIRMIEERKKQAENLKKEEDIFSSFYYLNGPFESLDDNLEFEKALEQRLEQLRTNLTSKQNDSAVIEQINNIISEMKRIGPVDEQKGKFDWIK